MTSAPELWDVNAVRRFFGGVSKTTIYVWVKQGKLAKPTKLGPMTTRWLRSDCEAALKKMQASQT